jgi:hypothetical protein
MSKSSTATRKVKKATSRPRPVEADDEVAEVPIFILDDELTQRLAKAIVHAVELCGGGDKDPFK